MPIVAEGDEEPNNTYVEQLTASARAAVQVGPCPHPSPPFYLSVACFQALIALANCSCLKQAPSLSSSKGLHSPTLMPQRL